MRLGEASEEGRMTKHQYDVIVVGAGFAGVTAARDLVDAEHSVLVLEARDRLGGRTWYRPFADTEQMVEFGGTWVNPDLNRAVAREVSRYDIALTESPEPEQYLSLIAGRLVNSPFPIPANQLLDFERAMYDLISAAHRINPELPLDTQGVEDLDIAFDDFLARSALPSETREFIDAWVRLSHGCETTELSALQTLSWIASLHYSATALALMLTTKFARGTIDLIDSMIADARPDVALESPVASVRQTSNMVEVATSAGDVHRAQAAVIAVPTNCWGDLEFVPQLSAAKMAVTRERHPGAAKKSWALTRNAPAFAGVGGPTTPFDVLATEYSLPGGDLIVGFATQGSSLEPSSRSSVQSALEDFVPEIEVVKVDTHDWVTDPFSKGTWLAAPPGRLSKHASGASSPEGRLAFATSDVAHAFSGWIDGAISAGASSAAQVERILGKR
jgi:monoamine oxidase